MSALNVRLPPALKSEAAAVARRSGISLNALVVLALQEKLDGMAQPSPNGALATVGDGSAIRPALDTGRHASGIAQDAPARPVHRRPDFTCPRRFKPSGILGASFEIEYRRSIDWHWYRKCDRRNPDGSGRDL